MKRILRLASIAICLISCADSKIEKKGFQVREILEDENGQQIVGLNIDSLQL